MDSSIEWTDPSRALALLDEALSAWRAGDAPQSDVVLAASRASGILRGYELPKIVLNGYRCHRCDATGVKLWRVAASSHIQGWCSRCGTEQAGLPDNIDSDGLSPCDVGTSDQIYSPNQGSNLVPWVPAPDGLTWGYTSIPAEGCEWWRALPTRPGAH